MEPREIETAIVRGVLKFVLVVAAWLVVLPIAAAAMMGDQHVILARVVAVGLIGLLVLGTWACYRDR